jgi:aminopeptidase N
VKDDVESYVRFALSASEEPLSTHSDFFITNTAFGIGSYVKGATFLQQLKYIEGESTFNKGMLEYFNQWKFKHPNVNDFIRVHEKISGLELDWFKENFVNTTNKIDYSVSDLIENGKKTKVFLKKVGTIPMPLDVVVTFANGTIETYNIPLDIMRGEKPNENPKQKWTLLPDWQWTNLNYEFEVDATKDKIVKVEIDPSARMADVERENNAWNKEK